MDGSLVRFSSDDDLRHEQVWLADFHGNRSGEAPAHPGGGLQISGNGDDFHDGLGPLADEHRAADRLFNAAVPDRIRFLHAEVVLA